VQAFFFKWLDRLEEEKLNKVNLLKKFKIERLFYKNNLKIAFTKLLQHKIESKVLEKEAKSLQIMNFKALKFWCFQTKTKVFYLGFLGNLRKI
jgi:hypothetical protein